MKSKNKKADRCKKLLVCLLITFCLCTGSLFAQQQPAAKAEAITALDDFGNKILNFFNSTWLKAILIVALIAEAIGMVVAGQQGGGGLFKKFMPLLLGTILILTASSIISYIWGSDADRASSFSLTAYEIPIHDDAGKIC